MKSTEKEAGAVPDASWSINEVIVAYPGSVGAFNALGVDSCCHGDDSLEVAAGKAAVGVDVLIRAILEATVGDSDSGTPA